MISLWDIYDLKSPPKKEHLHKSKSPSLDQSSHGKVAVKDTLMERGSVKGSQFQEPLIEFSVLVSQTRLAQGVKRCWLGGGFKHFLCSPLFGEMIQFYSYFSDGLKPPTSCALPKTQLMVSKGRKVSQNMPVLAGCAFFL